MKMNMTRTVSSM